MTVRLPTLAAAVLMALAAAPEGLRAQALTPAFTYQGELRSAGAPATASFDMEFRLFGAPAGGSQIGPVVARNAVVVADGLFSVPLDFGPAQFAGDRQWLEVRIKPAGAGSFETLAPRTEVTAAPYAWGAAVALADSVTGTSIVDGTVGAVDINAAQVQRRVSGSCPAGQYLRVVNQDGSVACGTDADAGGTVTSIATGAGLTGGPITATGTIAVAAGGIGTPQINASQVQRRVTGSCPVGQYLRVVNQDGSVACGTDATGVPGWGLAGNAGTNPATNFIGTTDNQPLVLRTANAPSLRIEPSAITFGTPALPITTNAIGGSHANQVTAGVRGATIAGGGTPAGNSDPDYEDESPNRVFDHYGSVGGGYGNRAGNNAGTTADRPFATVGGGELNTASGDRSTVGGGSENTASNSLSTVGGGLSNVASGIASTAVGGTSNNASGSDSSVGGGRFNTASGNESVVAGGASNRAEGDRSVVAGGSSNRAEGDRSVVAGGLSNIASGAGAMVSGGISNCAGGLNSWAGGQQAKVRPATNPANPFSFGACDGLTYPGGQGDSGTFIWADSQNANFISTGSNQFLVRAAGGVAINTRFPAAGTALTVNGSVALSTAGTLSFGSQVRQMLNLFGTGYGIGVQSSRLYFRVNPGGGFAWYEGGVHAGSPDDPGAGGTQRMRLTSSGQLQTTTGTIGALSDARLKHQVADYTDALDRINALRPVTYRYTAAGSAAFQPEGTHLGFIAQDVQQVFPQWVSEDDDGHLMLSMRGFEAVAVRAIQELGAENAALKDANAQLQARLAAIEARLGIALPAAR